MTRIAVAGFLHETNSFVVPKTDFDYFITHHDRPPLVRGADLLEWLGPSGFAMSGFLSSMKDEVDIVPLLWTSGGAGGTVTRDAFERISGEIVGGLSQALPVDAVFLDLHGAMVTDDFEDGEGELLRRIRAAVGDQIPILASLDYHANVTAAMLANADGLVGYYTYPHVDRIETGVRAAALVRRLLQTGRPVGRALRKAEFLIPLNDQCTLVSPSRDVVEASKCLPLGVFNLSYLAGFPASDLRECGPSFVAYAETQALADAAADALHDFAAEMEKDFAVPIEEAADAVRRAIQLAAGSDRPIVIADTQDNPGCGGTSDTTGMIITLLNQGAEGAVVGLLCDPVAARMAHEVGEGASIKLALGGRSGPAGVKPLEGHFKVVKLGDGHFNTNGQVTGKRKVDLGLMASLRIEGVEVVVTSKRMQAHDPAPFVHVGIDPAKARILVLKSTCHFRAEFEPIAAHVLIARAPGAFVADPTELPYLNLREGVRTRPCGPAFRPAVLSGPT
jgi:microcystin degradation protein MlrC